MESVKQPLNYNEVAYRLSEEAAIIIFRKKDNTVRVMLGTRDMRTMDKFLGESAGYAEMALCGHDKRCSAENGNIAVVDMIIDEPRCFNVNRVLMITYLGKMQTQAEFDAAVEVTRETSDKWSDFDKFTDVQQEMFLHNALG